MEKRISFDQFQSVKRVAQACNPLMVKREKLKTKIKALATEYNEYDTQIASLEEGIKKIIGLRVEQLVKKVIEPGVDANGLPKKTTKYLPTSIVSYDETKKQYLISIPDNEPTTPSETENTENTETPYNYNEAPATEDSRTNTIEEETTDNESIF